MIVFSKHIGLAFNISAELKGLNYIRSLANAIAYNLHIDGLVVEMDAK